MASILKVRDADGTVHEIYSIQGKSAYQYAQDGGYTGTEEEFAEKMAAPLPVVDDTLAQPGQAADAAAVGERLSALSEEIVTTSESKVAAHNSGTDTHSDIRGLIQGLTDRLNALADSDDTTLDQLSEVVAYIKSNRELIAAITTEKVSVADIIDNLTTNVSNKPLSAAQGVALKALIDAISIPDALPNPNALTFTGAVTGSYDGSAPLSVEIPSGGSGETIIAEETVLASGTIVSGAAANQYIDTGVTAGDLRQWEYFGFHIINVSSGAYCSFTLGATNSQRIAWDNVSYIALFKWVTSDKTVLQNTGYISKNNDETKNMRNMIDNFGISGVSGKNGTVSYNLVSVAGIADDTKVCITTNNSPSADIKWEIRGLIK